MCARSGISSPGPFHLFDKLQPAPNFPHLLIWPVRQPQHPDIDALSDPSVSVGPAWCASFAWDCPEILSRNTHPFAYWYSLTAPGVRTMRPPQPTPANCTSRHRTAKKNLTKEGCQTFPSDNSRILSPHKRVQCPPLWRRRITVVEVVNFARHVLGMDTASTAFTSPWMPGVLR